MVMTLTTTTMVTVDGVMQGPGGPDEDRRGGFDRGGWAGPTGDEQSGRFLADTYSRADAFLFGRWTFECFAEYWGARSQLLDNPFAQALNAKPKYVVSTSSDSSAWSNSTAITTDVEESIKRLKAAGDGELQVHGSGQLVRWLLERGLVDALSLVVSPIVVGQGTRLFPDSGPDAALELVASRSTPNGILLQTYRPSGAPRYQLAGEDSAD